MSGPMLTEREARPEAGAVRRFGELSRADVAFAGGKGANLGELTRAGLPVPSGFVVGAPAAERRVLLTTTRSLAG